MAVRLLPRRPRIEQNATPEQNPPCHNPVPADADQATLEKGVNFPALQRVIGNTT